MPVTAEPKATAIQDTSVENNLGLVHACAHRFKGRGIEYDDLYQAGCMGLVKASAAFDAGRGVMFSTYAVPVILGEIRPLFRDGGTVKVSRSLKELGLAAGRTRELLGSELGREATVNEVAERMGRAPEDVAQALAATTPPLSLTGGEEDGSGQIDLPEDKVSGLKIAMKVLDGIEDISICKLTGADVVRHQLVQKIIEAYEVYDKKNPPEPAAKSGPYRRKKQ